MTFPESFRDELYQTLDAQYEAKHKVPVGLVSSIRLDGERTNASRVSSAGARGPYQFTPATRKAVLEKYGIDPWLSPATASEGAAILLRDSLKRGGGDVERAIREYHGGTNTKAWGPINNAYADRVLTGFEAKNGHALREGLQQFVAKDNTDALRNDFSAWMKGGGKPLDQIPVDPTLQAPAATSPGADTSQASIGDQIIGAGEAALTTVTGATGGMLGMAAGTVGGIAKSVIDGSFGTQQGAQATEQAAMQGAQALTYAPRTPVGQEYAQNVGEVMQQAIPVMPLTNQLAGIGRLAGPARAQAMAGAKGVAQTVAEVPAVKAVLQKAGAADQPAPMTQQVAPLPASELGATMRTAAMDGMGAKQAVTTLAKQVMPDAEVVAASKALGIDQFLQADHVSSNVAFQQLAQFVKSQTGSAAKVAERDGLLQVAERANEIIQSIGGGRDLSTMSDKIRTTMGSIAVSLEKSSDAKHAQLRAAIKETTEVTAPNTVGFITKRATALGGVENLSPIEQMALRKLGGERPPTYALMDDVRRDVGSAARKSGLFKDADSGLAKKLYAELTSDQGVAAYAAGVGTLFEAARGVVKMRKGIEDDMTALFGKELEKSIAPRTDAAIKALSKGDTSKLVSLVDAIPKNMRREVVASGLASFFQATARGGEMDFGGFARWHSGLKQNKRAYAAVMANLDPQAAAQIEKLATVSRSIAQAKSQYIATGKAINPKILETADSFVGKVFDVVKANGFRGLAAEVAGSSVAPGLASALMYATTRNKPPLVVAADRLITSAAFVDAALNPKKTPPRKLARTPEFKTFARLSRDKRLIENGEAWIVMALAAQALEQETQ